MFHVKRGRSWRLAAPLVALALALAVGSLPAPRLSATPAVAAASTAPFVPGVVLVHRRAGTATARLTAEAGVSSVAGTLAYVGAEKLAVARGQELAIAQRLVQNGLADYAQPDYLRHTADVVPNDQYYPLQWDMARVEGPAAWGLTLGSTSVTVAVIDTGYYLAHPDRPVNLVQGPTYTAGSAPFDRCPPEGINGPDDDDGHGTHVGGTVAAAFNNGIGVAGLAPGVKLLVIKAGDCVGSFADSDIVQAIGYAVGNGAKVINMSFGGPGPDDVLNSAVQSAWSSGVVLVAAAGNESSNGFFSPADLANVVAVSATDQNDHLASYSNYGPSITVAAPGGDLGSAQILSTTPPSGLDSCGQYYCYLAGTSMAAPHVAAIAGLVLSYAPTLTNAQVVQALKSGAVPLGGSVPNQFYGYGRVDACLSLGAARSLAVSATERLAPAPLVPGNHLVYLPFVTSRVCL